MAHLQPKEGIEKIGNAITFAIDRHYNGAFVADMSHTFANINAVAPYLDPLNSRLFFGTAFPEDYFDDMLVAPIPEPATWLLGLITAGGLLPRRRRT
jgi:MYXO-CTERM domain-containing protein